MTTRYPRATMFCVFLLIAVADSLVELVALV